MNGIKRLTLILACVAAVATSAGIGTRVAQALWLDDRYATQDDLSKVDLKFELYVLDQDIRATQERLWQLIQQWRQQYHAEYGQWPADTDEMLNYMDEAAWKEYHELVVKLERLKEERARLLERMKKRGG